MGEDPKKVLNEMIELIKIWNLFNQTHWPQAKRALEEQINILGEYLYGKD